MACPVCASLNIQTKTAVEMAVYFSGFKLRGHPGFYWFHHRGWCSVRQS